MSLSVEFITATIFAIVMVLLGLGAIWIVRWQTYFLLRHQAHDPERGPRRPEPIVAEDGSVELTAARSQCGSCSRPSGATMIDMQHTPTDRLSCLSGSTTGDEASEDPETPSSRVTTLVIEEAEPDGKRTEHGV